MLLVLYLSSLFTFYISFFVSSTSCLRIRLHVTLILNIIVIIIIISHYIEYINDEWLVKHVWNYEQLMENKNEIQKSLIHHIVDDRLQEGTLVTDLIDSIKSSSSITRQLVSKPVINIVLINYCVYCFRRHNRECLRRRYLRKNQNY